MYRISRIAAATAKALTVGAAVAAIAGGLILAPGAIQAATSAPGEPVESRVGAFTVRYVGMDTATAAGFPQGALADAAATLAKTTERLHLDPGMYTDLRGADAFIEAFFTGEAEDRWKRGLRAPIPLWSPGFPSKWSQQTSGHYDLSGDIENIELDHGSRHTASLQLNCHDREDLPEAHGHILESQNVPADACEMTAQLRTWVTIEGTRWWFKDSVTAIIRPDSGSDRGWKTWSLGSLYGDRLPYRDPAAAVAP